MSIRKNESIKHFMISDVKTLALNNAFSDARKLMKENNIHHLPVLDGEKLVGMVSRIDVLKYSFSHAYVEDQEGQDAALDSDIKLQDIMTSKLVTLNQDTTVRDAANFLIDAHFSSLPVIDSSNKLVGIITSKDIMRYLIEQY